MKSFLCSFAWLALASCATVMTALPTMAETIDVLSPDKSVKVAVSLGNRMTYQVSFHGTEVLGQSNLGLKFKGQDDFGPVKVTAIKRNTVNQTWQNRLSKKSTYVDKCEELQVSVEEQGGAKRTLELVFRVYDDGIAFRYIIPKQPLLTNFVIEEDQTGFAFTNDEYAWMSEFTSFNTSQERTFSKKKLSSVTDNAFVICPLVVESEKYCAALTEAELSNWAGAQFAARSGGNQPGQPASLRIRLTPRKDGNGCVVGTAGTCSPWRVMLLGEKPVDLINNSGIILNVSTPCQLEQTDWIKPGPSSWDWWTEGNKVLNTQTLKKRIDLAAQMGWKYTTLDDPWYFNSKFQYKPGLKVDTTAGNGNVDIDEAFAYARSKGIGICLWLHYLDLIECGVEETFKVYEKWGAAGVKIDFMESDNQETVNWIEEVTRLGAKYHLLVNFHGMYKPTGLQRAFPNQITREGILGNEYNKFSDGVTTTHQATLPFTRFLCGPGDYTPGGFRNRHLDTFTKQVKMQTPPCQEISTRAHALALCCLYDSPLMTLCDDPTAYENQPGLEFLRNLPAVWDETTALDGEIGQYIVQVRRIGDRFYLAGITNEQARKVTVPLTFLKDNVTYKAQIFTDVPESSQDAEKISVSEAEKTSRQIMDFDMVRDGGFAVIFTPVK